MKPYYVTKVKGKPQQMELKLDSITIVYWGVQVEMMGDGHVIESIVTFDKLSKAKKLKVGDVFKR